MKNNFDVIIIGAGAAGLMCAIEAGKNGRSVLVIDHAKNPAEKIRISGGGRSNFTNLYATSENFISKNSHFCKSALSRYTQHDFIEMVEQHSIDYHEKKLGQLFCDNSAKDIINMLLKECTTYNVVIKMEISITNVKKSDGEFAIETNNDNYTCQSLVIATGGLSIPKMGATSFGYEIAKQFGHSIIDTTAGLVPLTFQNDILNMCKNLAGLSLDATITCNGISFSEGLLFTHRGLSGPSILQISSYWNDGDNITVNMLPNLNIFEYLKGKRQSVPKQDIQNTISEFLPKRLVISICENTCIAGRLADLSNDKLQIISNHINAWQLTPSGTEGYRTAEVTLGGVNTDELSSKNMESKIENDLYFIGEVVDVTGHLGGFNFQWAWSSGHAAGQAV